MPMAAVLDKLFVTRADLMTKLKAQVAFSVSNACRLLWPEDHLQTLQ